MSTDFPEDQPDFSEWISQAEAARLQGVTRQAISKLVRSGRLRTLKVGGRLLVNRSEIKTLNPKPPGRPKGQQSSRVQRLITELESFSDEEKLEVFRRLRQDFSIHPLEQQLGVEAEVLLDAIQKAPPMTLRMIRGVIAEASFHIHIVNWLMSQGWSSLPFEGNPPYDFLLNQEERIVRVQVKLQRSEKGRPLLAKDARKRFFPERDDLYVVETWRTRTGKNKKTDEETRYYRYDEYDILAVCMYPSSEDWSDFRFTVSQWLIPDPKHGEYIYHLQPVAIKPDEYWTNDFLTCFQWYQRNEKKTIDYSGR